MVREPSKTVRRQILFLSFPDSSVDCPTIPCMEKDAGKLLSGIPVLQT